MGHDATNFLPSSTSKKKLIGFIKILGFKGQGNIYHFYKDEDYKYLYGVLLNISENESELLIHTRTPVYCSNYDLQYQNNAIKLIFLLILHLQLLQNADAMLRILDFQICLRKLGFCWKTIKKMKI